MTYDFCGNTTEPITRGVHRMDGEQSHQAPTLCQAGSGVPCMRFLTEAPNGAKRCKMSHKQSRLFYVSPRVFSTILLSPPPPRDTLLLAFTRVETEAQGGGGMCSRSLGIGARAGSRAQCLFSSSLLPLHLPAHRSSGTATRARQNNGGKNQKKEICQLAGCLRERPTPFPGTGSGA